MARRRGLPLAAVAVALGVLAAGAQATPGAKPRCGSAPRPRLGPRTAPKPRKLLDASKTYDVTFATNCGSFTVRLAVKTSPHTAASFVSLVRHRYFDGTAFHRIVPGFIVQGGDPTARGTGTPGYETVDKPARSTHYGVGTVAMAKAPNEAPGTSGSQFFVCTGAAAAQLDSTPVYAVLGHVVKGQAVVRLIGRYGDPGTEQPTRLIEILHATVSVR
ncbi:MAG TPA: peptidylprolyl isomerase [Gaiellaceae bacterium]|nr:peptidylprolyl isomerase [Gaiellaceae bacterium]